MVHCKDLSKAKFYLNSNAPYFRAIGANAIKSSLASVGPASITVDAQNWGWYGNGVFSNCGRAQTHAAVLIGYQADGV